MTPSLLSGLASLAPRCLLSAHRNRGVRATPRASSGSDVRRRLRGDGDAQRSCGGAPAVIRTSRTSIGRAGAVNYSITLVAQRQPNGRDEATAASIVLDVELAGMRSDDSPRTMKAESVMPM